MEIKIPIVIDDKALEEAIDKRVAELKQEGDFVLVIRCKDCKYWQDNNNGYPHTDCRWSNNETPDADDFCSYAEQKEIEGERGMNVLSLFDGISCGMVALERAGIPVERYVAYEIDENAIKVSKHNYPQIEHCGDVTKADFTRYKGFDMVIGGSPCQDFSTLNRIRDGLDGQKSHLFWEFVRAVKEVEPKYFLLENNVSMSNEAKKILTETLGVEPIKINSALVSGQMRNRLYWTNIPNVTQPQDKGIDLRRLVKTFPFYNRIKLVDWTAKKVEEIQEKFGHIPDIFCPYVCTEITDKHYCLTAQGNSQTKSSTNLLHKDGKFYMFSADFWEILQTLPLGYTECLEKENRRKTVIGNGWTVDVIAHIFKGLTTHTQKGEDD